MTLTKTERLLLLNQYEILKRISDSEHEIHEYDTIMRALQDGYDKDFEQLTPHLSDPICEQVQTEVRDILEMFRALGPRVADKIPASAKFIGFDGNDEAEHYAYATFLLEDRNLWIESYRDDYNTHSPVLSDYREMLEEWKATGKEFNLSKEQTKQILAKAPHGCLPENQ